MSLNKSTLADIQKKMSKASKPKVPRNQWQHPGEITQIPGNNITMQGVGFPVLGIPNVGPPQMMQSGQDYNFPGASNVTEVPMMAYGGGLLSKSVNCKKCGHSWKAVTGGTDPLTCHKCGGVVEMQNGGLLENYEDDLETMYALGGEMIRRADGSYSKRGLWDNIRANRGSGKKPTSEMTTQKRRIAGQMQYGGEQDQFEMDQFKYGGHGGLDRWFAEKWVDVKTGKACGRKSGESRDGYPACRPSKRINEDTPKTSSELSSSEKAKFTKEKTSSDRINYQHRRREFGGEEMYNDMEEFKSGGNVPTNPSLWSRAKSMARQKYDVYPSAYANGWASKWYKSKGGGWRKAEYGMEVEMQNGGSLYDYMASRGMDANYKNRKKVFDKYFANNYEGTAQQNQQMLAMLRNAEKPNVNLNFSTPAVQAAMPAYMPPVQAKPVPKGMQRVTNKVDDRNWFERTLGINEDDIQQQAFDLPQDVYSYYNQYSGKNKGKKFGIVYKQNARGYFFDEKGNLALQDEVGLGKDKGEAQPVFYKTMTTPAGIYTMNRAPKNNTSATDYASSYGSDNFFYIQHTDPKKRLIPDPANPNRRVTAAVHGVPTDKEKDRLPKFNNNNLDDNRMSAGCINCKKSTLDNPYFTNIPNNTSLYVTPDKAYGGGVDNPGFRALPEEVQAKIMSNMAYGGAAQQAAIAMSIKAAGKKPKTQYADGGKMPEAIARARFAAAGNLDQMEDYGYAYGGYMPEMAKGGQANGEMALSQINAMMEKLDKLRKFIQPDTELEPWQASKITLMDDFTGSVHDNMMYSPENQEQVEEMEDMQMMAEGGIPERYKNKGFSKVGAKKQSTRPGKKWMVLAKKGDDYKVVHGGYDGMKDFSQHGSEDRKKNFWSRMGGKDSAKATDPFSPLYWHKRFGTWADGGSTFSGNAFYETGGMPCFECGGFMKQGGQHSVGDEMEVTPAQMAELKRQGYTFEVL